MIQWKAIIGLLFLFTAQGCSSFFYYPTRQLYYDPQRFGLKPEEVQFSSANGSSLFGWYFKNTRKLPPKAVVVFYHGNAENLSTHYLNLIWLLDHPYDFFIFDYQGYGRSEGSPSPERTVQDGEAALRLIHKRNPNLPIVVFGQSLGGAIALRNAIDLKPEIPLRLVVVDSTFPSYRSMARKALSRNFLTWPIQWLGWLLVTDSHAPKGEIHKISPSPLLVIHGTNDKVVEFEFGERIFAEAAEPKEFWTVPQGHHTDVFADHNMDLRKKFVERLDRAVRTSP